jgi:hypothetical protein
MKPGEIYDADFPGVGMHPVIVLSREDLNRGGQIGNEYRAELWHNRRLWRDVSITFDANGTVSSVALLQRK